MDQTGRIIATIMLFVAFAAVLIVPLLLAS